MPGASSMWMAMANSFLANFLCATLSSGSRLTDPAADREEAVVGDVVVRAEQQLGEDLRKVAGLAMSVDRLQALGHRACRDVALDVAAGALDERGDQLAGVFQAHRRVLAQADAA